MRLEIELRCILFQLIILEMFLQLGSPPVVNSIASTWFGKKHTGLYTVPQLTVHVREKNQAMRLKELSAELRDRIVLRHKSGEGYQKMSTALKVPKNTMASILLKWKKFGPPKTLPIVARSAKLSNWGRRTLVREVTKGEPSRKTTISAALHQSGLDGRVARRKPLLSKRHMTAHLEFAKRHLKDSGCEKQDSLVWWNQYWIIWPECQESGLEAPWHYPYSEAWWWQHHAVGMFVNG